MNTETIKPLNVHDALETLRELGYRPKWEPGLKAIVIYYFGNKVTFFVRKQYFNGKGLTPGYGFDNLVSQLKANPIPKVKQWKR